jgi:hypothetical protein
VCLLKLGRRVAVTVMVLFMTWLTLTAVKLCVSLRISGDGSATRVRALYCTHNKIILDTFSGKFFITTERGGTEYYILHYISKFTVTQYTIELHINFRCQDNTHTVLCKSSGLFSVTSFARWYK